MMKDRKPRRSIRNPFFRYRMAIFLCFFIINPSLYMPMLNWIIISDRERRETKETYMVYLYSSKGFFADKKVF